MRLSRRRKIRCHGGRRRTRDFCPGGGNLQGARLLQRGGIAINGDHVGIDETNPAIPRLNLRKDKAVDQDGSARHRAPRLERREFSWAWRILGCRLNGWSNRRIRCRQPTQQRLRENIPPIRLEIDCGTSPPPRPKETSSPRDNYRAWRAAGQTERGTGSSKAVLYGRPVTLSMPTWERLFRMNHETRGSGTAWIVAGKSGGKGGPRRLRSMQACSI